MFSPQTYQQRRERLCDQIGSGLILLPGSKEASMNYHENTYRFRQNSHFVYFVGMDQPELFAVIDVDARKTILFGHDLTMDDIIWTGPMPTLSEQALESGITETRPMGQLEAYVKDAIKLGRKIHFLPQHRAFTMLQLQEVTGIPALQLKEKVSTDLIRAVVAQRSVKTAEEIREIEKAAAVGYDMHMMALKMALPGETEHRIAGLLEGVACSQSKGLAFPIILTQRGEVLHGHSHTGTLEKGKFMICDAGAESLEYYSCDFTRTAVVGGKYTQQQRDIYQIVVDANNRAFDLIRPGIFFRDVHLASAKVLAEGLKSLGILKGDTDEAVAAGAQALFMPHGLGHMMGLDVHDMEDLGENYVGYDDEISRSTQFGLKSLRLGRRLQEGFVLTVEPGLYFIKDLIAKWEADKVLTQFIDYSVAKKFVGTGGIRVEDDGIVTADGCRFPGKRLPIQPEEIEALY